MAVCVWVCVGAGKELSKQQQHILKGIESIVAHAFFCHDRWNRWKISFVRFARVLYYVVIVHIYIYIKYTIGMLFNHDCHFKNFWFLKIHFIASQIIRTVHKFRCVFAYTLSSFKLVHLVGFVGYQFPFQLDALYICDSQCGMYTCMESVWQMKLNYFKCILAFHGFIAWNWFHILGISVTLSTLIYSSSQ